MKQLIISLFLFASFSVVAQDVKVVTFDQLEKRWTDNNDTLYLINYWATWCQPCVEELPEFIKLEREMEDHKFKMILVSLDFPKHLDGRVKPFLSKNNITSEVVILDDDANVWINRVNPDWAGISQPPNSSKTTIKNFMANS